MKRVILLTLSLTIASFIGFSQNGPNFKAFVSTDSVLFGNPVKVSFQLENSNGGQFSAPDFEGFNVISGPNRSSSYSMMNGSITQSVTYSYLLNPKDIGNYYIPPASIETPEAILESEPLEILVFPNPDNIIQDTEEIQQFPGSDFGGFNFKFDWFDDFPAQPIPPQEKEGEEIPPKKKKKKRKTYRI